MNADVLSKCVKGIAIIVTLYFFTFLIVFNLGAVAYPEEEDTFEGRTVAYGPRPRSIFAVQNPRTCGYKGDEWPFFVYRPLCFVYRMIRGLNAPAQWRPEGN